MNGSQTLPSIAKLIDQQSQIEKEVERQVQRTNRSDLLLQGKAIGPIKSITKISDSELEVAVENNSPINAKIDEDASITFVKKDREWKGVDGYREPWTEEEKDAKAGIIKIKVPKKDMDKAQESVGGYIIQQNYDLTKFIKNALQARPKTLYPPNSIPNQESVPKTNPNTGNALTDPTQKLALQSIRGDNDLLATQGPPGTGKTRILSHIAAENTIQEESTLIIAFSNQAVENALEAVYEQLEKTGMDIKEHLFKKGLKPFLSKKLIDNKIQSIKSEQMFKKGICIGTTFHSLARFSDKSRDRSAWPQFKNVLIDEAGQASYAMAAIAAAFSKNIILFGDQNQLPPINPVSDQLQDIPSAMEHLEEIRPNYIITLDRTFRLNEQACKIIQDHFYHTVGRGKTGSEHTKFELIPDDYNKNSQILDKDWDKGIALIDHPFKDINNINLDEINLIGKIIENLIGKEMRLGENGQTTQRKVAAKDIAILTPFRRQAEAIKQTLKKLGLDNGKIGTVNKMQGASVPITIYSMAAGRPQTIADMGEFLFQPNRWNVALSRSNALTLVVGNQKAHNRPRIKTMLGMQNARRIGDLLEELPKILVK